MTAESNDIAQSTQHLNEEELHVFIENPTKASYTALRLHIANCSECLRKVDALQNAQSIVMNNLQTISTTTAGEIKSRLHTITHELAMDDASITKDTSKMIDNREKSISPQSKGFMRSWLSSLFHFEVNWIALPVTAMASIFFAWLILPLGSDTTSTQSASQTTLVSFQDTQGMIYQNQPQPGLGFFHQNDQKIQEYTGFSITLNTSDGNLNIAWPVVDSAKRYTIRLQEVSNNVSKEISTAQIQQNRWQVNQSLLKPGVLYRLHLSGKTDTDINFHYSGGFVFQ